MNKIFKVVWSKSRSMFVVASEMATAHGGGSSEKSSCRSHADESLAHATRALKLKALVVAVCAAGGGGTDPGIGGQFWDVSFKYWLSSRLVFCGRSHFYLDKLLRCPIDRNGGY
ncbi:TPA: ESPR domain-containing protein [Burkholderia vietnamiensis]|uniref:ESPR domain-containing protein n=1 Tax=Burkholderia vietnamiensis TaxID=60552 RepID=UPI001BA2E090|nr:ESPR domain-containing protein [Burkholderia vietnamiensis]MBR8188899.1 ESPR domain-containing protein [Burkholderia vietnamiensis]HDR9277489.1 ESPR domain-containing protein [Burkholderia vietnamiensis]